MLTNLVASIVVSLVTNTTERLPIVEFSNFSILTLTHEVVRPPPLPQKKWIRTTVTESRVLLLSVEGRDITNELSRYRKV